MLDAVEVDVIVRLVVNLGSTNSRKSIQRVREGDRDIAIRSKEPALLAEQREAAGTAAASPLTTSLDLTVTLHETE